MSFEINFVGTVTLSIQKLIKEEAGQDNKRELYTEIFTGKIFRRG